VKIVNTMLPLAEASGKVFELEHHYKDHDRRHRRVKKGTLKPQAEVVILIRSDELNDSHHLLLVSFGQTETHFIPNRYVPVLVPKPTPSPFNHDSDPA
jgi:hypothetical protein